ncbi:MAG: sigma-70 family RNA polymerase sigma factor [Ruminococcaceae bacterium]|nr:sigma-70 family RNA polymerase sigma factor [Oscillospiraceae bacterium]
MPDYVNDPETLLAAKNGDEAAMEQVVSTNLGLVKSIALRFTGRGVETEDLIQIGTLGMIKAIRGFQAEKECKFTTYAVPLILGEIKRFLRDDGWIKISRDTRANGARIFRFTEEYEKKEGKSPTLEVICSALDLTEEKAVLALEAARPALSLYAEDENTGFSPEKIIGEDNIEQLTTTLALREAVDALPRSESHLIRLRYFHNLTQEQTARILGLTQVKVSREEKRILQKMRETFFSAS